MNFSDSFHQTNQLCKFSPNGQFLANAVQHRVMVRDVKSLQIINMFSCLDVIQKLEWSKDSSLILCAMFKRALIQVWSLEQPEWTCKIDEGSAGLKDIYWSPDSRHILTVADFHLRITVWSLLNKSVSYIKYPKSVEHGLDFTEDGQYMALAECRDGKDYLSIFVCSTWQLIRHFEVNTKDLTGLRWSPDGIVLCIWESLLNYKVLLYSIDGKCLYTYSAYDQALGVKTITWSPTGQFLAIGSYDEKIRVLNHVTWKVLTEYNHPQNILNQNTIVYQETEQVFSFMGEDTMNGDHKYEILDIRPVKVPSLKPDSSKPYPKLGVGFLAYSCDNNYLASQNDNMPNTLWIWSVKDLCLAVVLMQLYPIKCVKWDWTRARLALCCGTNSIFIWSPAGCAVAKIPDAVSFPVHSLSWQRNEEALLLIGKDAMCVCYLNDSSDEKISHS